jgi:hypothetical protein
MRKAAVAAEFDADVSELTSIFDDINAVSAELPDD